MKYSGIVLCGGLSSRMGRDKAWLPWQGRPLVSHVVEKLREAVDEIVVVAAPDQKLPSLPARIIRDRAPHLGPLAGIREGLENIHNPFAFVTATDAPHLTGDFVRSMLSLNRSAALDVDGFVQTLSAVYSAEAGAVATRLLEAGRRRPLDLLEKVDFKKVDPDQVPHPESVRGFNSPEAYLEAVRQNDLDPFVKLLQESHPSQSVPIGTLSDVLRAASINPDEFDVHLDEKQIEGGLGIPVGPGETIRITPSGT